MLSFAMAVAISASIMRAVSTLNESRLKPQYFFEVFALYAQNFYAVSIGKILGKERYNHVSTSIE